MPFFFENRIGRVSDTVVDMRLLELRSGLFFEYPKLNKKAKNLIFFLPFFENPIITQSKEARLISYDLINQNSTLFSHVGSKARELTVEMTLTIPHIMRSINSVENSQRLLKSLSTDTEKRRFGAENIRNPLENDYEVKTSVAEEVVRHWKELIYDTHQGSLIGDVDAERNWPIPRPGTYVGGGNNTFIDPINDPQGQPLPFRPGDLPPEGPQTVQGMQIENRSRETIRNDLLRLNISKTALRAINSVIYILETIKTSVTANSVNSILGPPTLRLRHGAMYVDVPCICKSYNMNIEEDAGYDLKTLIPNRIKINLDLAELRGGDFTKFSPGEPVKRDNMAGWEALIQYGTTDPGYLR